MIPDERPGRNAGMPYTLGLGGASHGVGRGYGWEGESDGPPGPEAVEAGEARGRHPGYDSPGVGRAGASATAEGGEVKGAATITATYIAHGAKFRVLIRPANAKRLTRVDRKSTRLNSSHTV